jgi:hypothetical protein
MASHSATTAPARDGAAPSNRGSKAREAAARARARNSIHVEIPNVGHLHLPPLDQIAFIGGIAVLAAIQIVEWPVAVALTAGHVLAHNRHHALLRDFGEALDEA